MGATMLISAWFEDKEAPRCPPFYRSREGMLTAQKSQGCATIAKQ
jgi:hypothetical protein